MRRACAIVALLAGCSAPAVPSTATLPEIHLRAVVPSTTTTVDWRPGARYAAAVVTNQRREAIVRVAHHAPAIPARARRRASIAPPPPSQPRSGCAYAALIRSIWQRDAEWAIGVAWSRPGHPYGESHCVATAWDGGVGHGLFQISLPLHDDWFTAVGCSPAQWADPTCAVKAAWHGYQLNGRAPWA